MLKEPGLPSLQVACRYHLEELLGVTYLALMSKTGHWGPRGSDLRPPPRLRAEDEAPQVPPRYLPLWEEGPCHGGPILGHVAVGSVLGCSTHRGAGPGLLMISSPLFLSSPRAS